MPAGGPNRKPSAIRDRLLSEPLVRLARESLEGWSGSAWVVGGAVRDVALGAPVTDLDLAVAGDPAGAARAIAARAGGSAFELSSEFGTWRVAGAGHPGRQIDVTVLRGASIEADLAGRDFTIGAVALALVSPQSAAGRISADGIPVLLDPHGGLADLAAGVVRAVSEHSFSDDPLRLLRAARLASRLGFEIDPETSRLARACAGRAGEPAPERQLEELRLLLAGRDPRRGLALAEELGALAVILPELTALRGVEQGPNHHLDVYDHTLAVLDGVLAIEADPAALLDPDGAGGAGAELADAVAEHLGRPLADGFDRAAALRFGALFHDLGKPATRTVRDGFTGFPGHDRAGAEIVAAIGRRLAFSRRLSRYLQDLALHHLRLGFLIPERPLPPRRVHGYLRATGEVAVDVTLLTVADRLAARGTGGLASGEMVAAHLELAREMVAEAVRWRSQGPPDPLLRGDEIAAALGIEAGPALGELVAELEAAQFAGEVADRDGAITHLRRFDRR